ncbi:hypothetical protein WMY93_031931 [Mugilogobius chulae]|uniref:Ig-like domain-containing protein n=1 Tax=Mugilogobius chulae TaxID=88201 RepID=A0AAW0MCV1_9GOBI
MSGTWGRVCVLLLLQATDGYLNVFKVRCKFNASHPEVIHYIKSWFFNKAELIRFDERVGRFEGYGDVGRTFAEGWNKDLGKIQRATLEKELFCASNTSEAVVKGLSMSVTLVYGFFPKHISVSWTNNKINITTGVTSTDLLPDGDWYYQLHSHLEYQPRSGDQISCVIEHISLKEPLVLDWDDALSDGDRNRIAIGASGLVLGLLLFLAGFLFYKHKSRGLRLELKKSVDLRVCLMRQENAAEKIRREMMSLSRE